MEIKKKGKDIMKMTRGDTAKFKFQRKDENGNAITTIADSLWFTVKTNNTIKEVVIQKSLSDMTFDEEYYYHFTIEPEDTNKLEYGDYLYDIEVIQDDYKKTISKGVLSIEYEITFAENEV